MSALTCTVWSLLCPSCPTHNIARLVSDTPVSAWGQPCRGCGEDLVFWTKIGVYEPLFDRFTPNPVPRGSPAEDAQRHFIAELKRDDRVEWPDLPWRIATGT